MVWLVEPPEASSATQAVMIDLSRFSGLVPVEIAGGSDFPRIGQGPYVMTLGPHGYFWLSLRREAPAPVTVKSQAVPSGTRVMRSPLLLGQDWSRVLSTSAKEILERRYLLPYLRRQRWFGHDDPKATATIEDFATLTSKGSPRFLALVGVRAPGRRYERYLLPLSMASGAEAEAVLHDAADAVVASIGGARKGVLFGSVDAAMAADLLSLFRRQQPLRFQRGQLAATREPSFDALTAGAESLVPNVGSANQSNSSVRFGSHLILKVIRRVTEGISPEVEIGHFLNEAGFTRAPRLAGWLEYGDTSGSPSRFA